MVNIRHIVIYLTTIKYAFYIPGWYMTNLFLPQLSMPCIFLADVGQIYIFLPSIKYALYINGTYVTDSHVPAHLSMPCIFKADIRHI